jgi:predicted RNase H-like HicB family nuclease
MKEKILDFDVIIEEDEDGGFVVSVPALPGCFTQGDSMDEVLKNAKEAIGLYLETMDSDEPIRRTRFVGIHRVSVFAKTH